jgi:hypothetical protein
VTVPSLSSGIVPILDRPMRLLDVIPVEPVVGTDQFSYLKETVRTHAAVETAPAALKPTSTYNVQKVDDAVRTRVHFQTESVGQSCAGTDGRSPAYRAADSTGCGSLFPGCGPSRDQWPS